MYNASKLGEIIGKVAKVINPEIVLTYIRKEKGKKNIFELARICLPLSVCSVQEIA